MHVDRDRERSSAEPPLTEQSAVKVLAEDHTEVRSLCLRERLAADPLRGERLTAEAAGLYLDRAKNRLTDETIGRCSI